MQFRFYARQRNDRCMVILRKLQEEYLDKEKKLYNVLR